MSQENEEKGKAAEKLFEQYLNEKKIPFYYIAQDKESKSEELKNKGIRRPDYLALTKTGACYIDVKFRNKIKFGTDEEKRFPLDQYIINTLFEFQKEFRQEIWLAFTNNLEKPEFFYVSVSQVYEYYENIKKNYEKNYQNLVSKLIYIPNSLLFNSLSYEKSFYKEVDWEFYGKEANSLEKTADYQQWGNEDVNIIIEHRKSCLNKNLSKLIADIKISANDNYDIMKAHNVNYEITVKIEEEKTEEIIHNGDLIDTVYNLYFHITIVNEKYRIENPEENISGRYKELISLYQDGKNITIIHNFSPLTHIYPKHLLLDNFWFDAVNSGLFHLIKILEKK
jgi:hypothetical protein